jgi:hypothetical protein
MRPKQSPLHIGRDSSAVLVTTDFAAALPWFPSAIAFAADHWYNLISEMA